MKIDIKHGCGIGFEDLESGDLFLSGGRMFVKTSYIYDADVGEINAVQIGSGNKILLGGHVRVIKVNKITVE